MNRTGKQIMIFIFTAFLLLPPACSHKKADHSLLPLLFLRDGEADYIDFSGYRWEVKSGPLPVGPGPNYFSGSSGNVRVDTEGLLHLGITHRSGRWQCAEVFLEESLGYGKYIFYLEGRPDLIDKNVVLGLFTWDDEAPPSYREIDIEISRWGSDLDDNTQFVVQPWDVSGNMSRFNTVLTAEAMTCSFTWTADKISFDCLQGHSSTMPGEGIIAVWEYSDPAYIPTEGQERVHINFWLCDTAPSDGREAEVVISGFEFMAI